MAWITAAEYRTLTQTAADTYTDATINLALERYSSLLEGYVQRQIVLDSQEDEFISVEEDPLPLPTYPVDVLTSVTADGAAVDLTTLTLHKKSGLLYHDGRLDGADVVVAYEGGYADVPHDLKMVLITLAQGFLEGIAGGVNSIHAVKKETVMGVATLEYSDINQASIGDAAFAELGPYTTVLDRYRATSFF